MSIMDTRVVVGVDADARGLAWYARRNNGTPDVVGYVHRSHKTKGMFEDYPEDLARFVDTCAAHKAVVYVEDVYFLRNMKTFRTLAAVHAELAYEIIRQCKQFDITLRYVTASQWQSVIFCELGIINWKDDTKDSAAQAVGLLVPGATFANEHEVDACCIAHYGERHLDGKLEDK